MKTNSLFIIMGDPDKQVLGSARGLIYKYMINCNANYIYVYRFDVGACQATLTLSASRQDGSWVIIEGVDAEDEFVEFSSEKLDDINEISAPSAKKYKPGIREYAAIFVCHGSSSTIDSIAPELFAQSLIRLTNTAYGQGEAIQTKPFPVFTKIVFNTCFLTKQTDKPKAGTKFDDIWDPKLAPVGKKTMWQVSFDEKQLQSNIQQKHEAKYNNGTKSQNKDDLKADYVHDSYLLTKSPLVKKLNWASDFLCIFRFLNIYGAKFPGYDIMVAGYEEAITAYDVAKNYPKEQQKPKEEELLKYSGKRTLVNGTQTLDWVRSASENLGGKKYFKFTASNSKISSIERNAWTDELLKS